MSDRWRTLAGLPRLVKTGRFRSALRSDFPSRRRRSQVVRQWIANPPPPGSNPGGASKLFFDRLLWRPSRPSWVTLKNPSPIDWLEGFLTLNFGPQCSAACPTPKALVAKSRLRDFPTLPTGRILPILPKRPVSRRCHTAHLRPPAQNLVAALVYETPSVLFRNDRVCRWLPRSNRG